MKKILDKLIMPITEDTFRKMVPWYPTKHLFKNYYLMRNNAYGIMGPHIWGVIKVVEKEKPDTFIF